MVKLPPKIFVWTLGVYAALSVLLYLNTDSFGININSNRNFFQSIIPDSYSCPEGCNTCSFKILKFGLFYGSINASCTLLGCSPGSYKQEHRLCRKDWKKSQRLDYQRLPKFTNYCLNDYRNITYIERQNRTNHNFTRRDSQSLRHTRLALSQGIESCNKLHNWLKTENQFNDKELLKLATYMRIRGVLNSKNRLTRYLSKEDIIKLKEIFDFINENRNRFDRIISKIMLQQFEQEYNLVINLPPETIKAPDNF